MLTLYDIFALAILCLFILAMIFIFERHETKVIKKKPVDKRVDNSFVWKTKTTKIKKYKI